MLRNKPLHGFTPAGVFTHDHKSVVAWNLGATTTHLTLGPAGILVDCLTLADDLCKSMEDFAVVLDENTEPFVVSVGSKTELKTEARPPRSRWIRAFWARFCPVGICDPSGTSGVKGPEAWMKLGETTYGIPTK